MPSAPFIVTTASGCSLGLPNARIDNKVSMVMLYDARDEKIKGEKSVLCISIDNVIYGISQLILPLILHCLA